MSDPLHSAKGGGGRGRQLTARFEVGPEEKEVGTG